MTAPTLLASLALRLAAHPENIATEGLLHVLQIHAASAAALADLLRHAGLPALPRLMFRTQVSDADGAIPDLVGIDASGASRLIVEAKFWAHLTDHQPVTYLQRLAADHPSVLLFICPAGREVGLWDQLQSRARASPDFISAATGGSPPSRLVQWLQTAQNRYLAIVSWRALLSALASDAGAHGDRDYEADVGQLQGLCERVDSEAFLPLRDSELAPEIGKRAAQFADLVDATVEELKLRARPGVSTEGLTTGGRHGAYGRFFSYGRIGGVLLYSPALWGKYQLSPLWLLARDRTLSTGVQD
jgi:hypothetical protein